MVIYCDGAKNSLGCAICVIKGKKHFVHTFEQDYSSVEVEYLAVLRGIEIATDNETVYSDNEQVVLELNGDRRPGKSTKDLYLNSMGLLIDKKNIQIKRIARNKNLAGIYLEQRLSKLRNYVSSACRGPRLKKDKTKYIKNKKLRKL